MIAPALPFCTLEEAFRLAQRAEHLDTTAFLTQARNYLAAGKLRASGFACALTLNVFDFEFEAFPLSPNIRTEIPAVAWIDFDLSFHLGGLATVGNPEQSPLRMIPTREGAFDVTLYTDVRLSAAEVATLWRKPAASERLSDDEVRAIVSERRGLKGADLTVRELNEIAKNNAPKIPRDQILRIAEAAQGPRIVGRPLKPKNAQK
jgi:hypothetical protein